MAAGAPVTVATAQILVNVGGDAAVRLQEIGTAGAVSIEGLNASAVALSNNMQRLTTSTSELGANELALAGSSGEATVALQEQSAAAELFNKKIGKLLDGTTILTKFFKTFASFLVATVIYGALNKLIGSFSNLRAGGEAAAKAADDYKSALESIKEAQLTLEAGAYSFATTLRLPDGTVQSVRSYGLEIDALAKKISSEQQALQKAREDMQHPGGLLGLFGFGGGGDAGVADADAIMRLSSAEQEAAKAAQQPDESMLDAHFRLMNDELARLKYLDPVAEFERISKAQASVDKATQSASQAMLQWLNESKEGLKVSLQLPEEQETYALKLKATNAALQMNIDLTSQKLLIDKILLQHEQVVFEQSSQALDQRQKLLGLSQQEVELMQLKEQLHGSEFKDSDPAAQAAIAAQTARLQALQVAERDNQTSRSVADTLASVPETAIFEHNLKKAATDALVSAARIAFSDTVTRFISDAIYKALATTATDLPGSIAQEHLAAVMPPHTLAIASMAALMPAHTAALTAAATAGVFVAAAEGAVWQGSFTPFAGGGIANGPTMGLVGEGPYPAEAMVPLPDGRTIPVTMTGGGGDFHVHVHMNVQAIDSRDFKAHLTENADHVGNVIIGQLRGRNRQLLDRVRSASRGKS